MVGSWRSTRRAPPEDLEIGTEKLTRVSIFMNVFNVHINRSPTAGRITRIAYRAGAFLNASLDKASEDNERQSFLMSTLDGRQLVFVQIAGLVARRIVRWVEEGHSVSAGERVGMIRFGSRVDVYLDPDMTPAVSVGQTMIGGETVIANARPKGERGAAQSGKTRPDQADERSDRANPVPRGVRIRPIPDPQPVAERTDPYRAVRRPDGDPSALQGQWEQAVIAITVAGVFDALDGRMARLLKGTSKFGAELDSLSDVISFGVAPALVMYLWALRDLKGAGWVLALAFCVCCALRLARFNTAEDDPAAPAWSKTYFVGVPAPGAAGLALLPLMADLHLENDLFRVADTVRLRLSRSSRF